MSEMLKKIRIEKGYTQEYMAEQLGYKDKSGYNHLENGNVKLSVERAMKIASILDVDPMVFFTKRVQVTSTKEHIS